MKRPITILLLMLCFITVQSQNFNKTQNKYFLTGHAEISGIIHGGAYHENVPPPKHQFSHMTNFTFIIVKARGDSAYVFKEFTTDLNGDFSVELPAGRYGLWPGNEPLTNPKAALTGPLNTHTKSGTTRWTIELTFPFEIKNQDIRNIRIRCQYDGYAP